MNVPSSSALYLRLLAYVKPYWKAFTFAVIGMLGMAATEPVFPAILKYLLDHGLQASDKRIIWLIPISIVLLFFIRSIFSFCTSYLMTWISTNIITDLRRQMFSKILVLPTYKFNNESSGKLISRLLYDADNVNGATTTVLVTAIKESFTTIALLVYLFYLDWILTIITLTVAPLVAIIIRGFSKRMRAASRESMQTMRQISHTIEEATAANKVIKIYSGQNQIYNRFFENTEKFRRSLMREAIPASAITPITHLTASLAVAIITYLALSNSTVSVGTSPGGFVSFITAMLLLISPIKQLTSINSTIQRGLSACESVFDLLDSQSEMDTGNEILPNNIRGDIFFDQVSFRYPGSDHLALVDISFKISAGQNVALVGASGGGKTTISSLIPRFYQTEHGKIFIDGIDINNITLESLRKNISLVSQDIVLFNDTVEANIKFGSQLDCSQNEVINAAKAANAWEFIEQLPHQLETIIGEGGARLSGGQRQRIAIARAILKNASILILDEATSSLDTESERQVQHALTGLMKDRTTLIIAHRLTTIERSDFILVLDNGKIVEQGTHSDLLLAGGYYANLNKIQK